MDAQDKATEKKKLRDTLSAHRAQQDPAKAAVCAEAAQHALMVEDLWRDARQVALYVPIRGEVETALLLADAWKKGKQTLLPRCRPGAAGQMDFVVVTGMHELVRGHFGILEPLPQLPPLAWQGARACLALDPDLIVVPGVSFDRRGYRLGFGGGYYDRALGRPALLRARRVGLAYAWQIQDILPTEAWDMRVHALCTEEGIAWI